MSLRRLTVGGTVVAVLIIAIHLLFPVLPLGGPLWDAAAVAAGILLVITYVWRNDDVDAGSAIALLLGGFGYVEGLKVLVVSSVVLLDTEISVPPFGSEELALIAAWGFIMMLVASMAIRDAWAGKIVFSRPKA